MALFTDNLTGWTALDLVQRFGPIPLDRMRLHPAPGTATEQDVVGIQDREDRLYELVDGTLVEKTVGTYEAYLAALVLQVVGAFVREHDLGIVLGADGMLRIATGMVRIPDMSFIAWSRLPNRQVPRAAIADLVPDLAVEVLSTSNTPQEMQRKLVDYFAAGVREVWYVYPTEHAIDQHFGTDKSTRIKPGQSLLAGEVLSGFALDPAQLFGTEPYA